MQNMHNMHNLHNLHNITNMTDMHNMHVKTTSFDMQNIHAHPFDMYQYAKYAKKYAENATPPVFILEKIKKN